MGHKYSSSEKGVASLDQGLERGREGLNYCGENPTQAPTEHA